MRISRSGEATILHMYASICECVLSLPVVLDSVTAWTVAHQASPSMEFSRGMHIHIHIPFPGVCTYSESESEVTQSCPTLDCSLPGASVRGIFQARILEWFAIVFSRRSSPPRD